MNLESSPIYLHPPGLLCALGHDTEQIRAALFAGASPGMRASDTYSPGVTRRLGHVDAPLPDIGFLPVEQRSRNNALLLAAFERIAADYYRAARDIPPERIGVVLGTSTSGMFESETSVRALEANGQWPDEFHYLQLELGSGARMLAEHLNISGPAYAVSTACTSSAKSLISGARLILSGQADLVLAAGVDTLTRFTLAGFSSLGAVASDACLPFSANRAGINIGEAVALFLLSRKPPEDTAGPFITLAGWGESSDGYHISAPDPAGGGAKLAISAALARAGITADDIGYVNLHGTATAQNDAMESNAMATFFSPSTPMSSTKPLTGHTLGAAGALEAAICWLALTDADRRLPPHLWDNVPDPTLPPLNLVAPGSRAARLLEYALSTSFAFGGSNTALILGRETFKA